MADELIDSCFRTRCAELEWDTALSDQIYFLAIWADTWRPSDASARTHDSFCRSKQFWEDVGSAARSSPAVYDVRWPPQNMQFIQPDKRAIVSSIKVEADGRSQLSRSRRSCATSD